MSTRYQPNRQLLHAGLSPLRRVVEKLIEYSLLFCGVLSIIITIAIAVIVVNGTVQFFTHPTERVSTVVSHRHSKCAAYSGQLSPFLTAPALAAASMDSAHEVYAEKEASVWNFLTDTKWDAGFQTIGEDRVRYGILPLLSGTLMVALIAALVAVPLGLITAVFLSEYASPRIRDFVKPVLELLAGIPTVVYGFFAITVITPFLLQVGAALGYPDWLDHPQNQLSGGIVVGIMILPMVASLSEDALRAVPNTLREASYALGATKFETSWRVVVPAALSGIIASFILAISRAVGETMAVSLACGGKVQFSLDPTVGVATMTSFIVRAASGDVQHGSAYFLSLFAVAGMLFAITLTMNIISQWILHRYRQVYQ
jgi:phosphate transport system permease protein